MKRILFIVTICLLGFVFNAQAQIDHIISVSGEVGNLNSTLDFLDESGNITRFPRMTDAGELLYYAPLVTTDSVPAQSVFSSSAIVYGNILFNGWNNLVQQQGFQYCTDTNQTDGIHTLAIQPSNPYTDCENPCANNIFQTNIISLTPSTTYYIRAFAVNASGTGYGRWITITTQEEFIGFRCGNILEDIRGDEKNEYGTVQIGTQCWMKENLKTLKKPDGSVLSSSGIFTHTDADMGKLYYYDWGTANQASSNIDIHTSLQGICPEGWHLPSYDDINTLCTTVDSEFSPIDQRPNNKSVSYESNNGLSIKLCYPAYWANSSKPGTPGYWHTDPTGFNTTGLSILPTGYKDTKGLVCPGSSHIWMAVGTSNRQCDIFKLPETTTGIVIQNSSASGASFFAVRCLKDSATGPALPSVTTYAASNVGAASATLSGAINSDGNVNLIEKGFYYSKNVDVLSGKKAVVSGATDNFSAQLSGLESSTTYYYRAYAVNEMGMSYGELFSFTTKQPASLASVDIEETQGLLSTSINILCSVVTDGGENVTERGICWSTTSNPTISHDKKQDTQNGIGDYLITADGLTPNTTYYFRAYAINGMGTAYSDNVTVTTPEGHIPDITTDYIDNISANTATAHASITSQGNAIITACGFIYDTIANSADATVVLSNPNNDHFSVLLSELKSSTTYYIKAFATNALGTAYGQELSFTTDALFECGSTVTDNDQNIYHTIQIGQQCWMKENLRTTTYTDGNSITQGQSSSETQAYWYYPGNSSANVSEYGLLYNWKAAIHDATPSIINPSSIQGICPTGWHVPDGNDWNELIKYVKGQDAFVCDASNRSIANALAFTDGWQNATMSCSPGYNMTNNDAAGFSARPAGLYNSTSRQITAFGQTASFWGLDNSATGNETRFYLDYQSAVPFLQSYSKQGAMSVRCLQDRMDSLKVLPIVVTSPISAITPNTAVTGGNVLSDAESNILKKGVCYSTQPHPTLDNHYTIEDGGQGTFISQLSALEQATTYYVRAYAENNAGVAYGNEVIFMTANPDDGHTCAEVATIYDNDGNDYATVQIGAQCWMKSNLRTTTYSDGTPINLGTVNSQTTAYRYATSNLTAYGYLYNWKAVMHGAESSSTLPSHVQGICPVGWHVPSDAEWTQLTDYVNSQSQYRYNQKERAIAKALASTSNWSSYSEGGAVGSSPSNNNATGFNIQPAGAFYNTLTAAQKIAAFWSSTADNNGNAYFRYLQYFYGYVGKESHDIANGFSVRCLKDDYEVNLPEVTTAAVTDITDHSAVCGGNIVTDGEAQDIVRGVCWSTASTPTIYDAHTTDGTGAGQFTSSITGLTQGTTYFVRAYATIENQTVYGGSISFTTQQSDGPQPCPGMETVSDRDGNEYNTMLIGKQCWMKENLRATKYANGTSIEQGSDISTDNPYWYYPNDNADTKSQYGLLYNWAAAMNIKNNCNATQVQGICPIGWHIPDESDWNTLTDNLQDKDVSYFNALAAGMHNNATNQATAFGQTTSFWGADNVNATTGTRFYWDNASAAGQFEPYHKASAMSVRCLHNSAEAEAVLPSAVTFDITDVTSHSVTVGGNVYDDGESDVTMKGVCYGTKPHPTTDDNFTTDDCGLGKYVSHLTNLEPGTIYYVRAYAQNSVGIAYGNEIIFMTYNPEDGNTCATVSDHDGNTYTTVHIGGQCWMAEHLRTTTYSDGTPIAVGTTTSDDAAFRYTPSNSNTYGYLYNWRAVMRFDESSNNVPSGVQGICPDGWHVPSQAEWTLFSDYVNSINQYRYNNKSRAIAKALASTSSWSVYSEGGAVGSNLSQNNATGFNIKPAGGFYGSTTANGKISALWSSTATENGNAYSRYLLYYYGYLGAENHNIINGFSVRCVKD